MSIPTQMGYGYDPDANLRRPDHVIRVSDSAVTQKMRLDQP